VFNLALIKSFLKINKCIEYKCVYNFGTAVKLWEIFSCTWRLRRIQKKICL